jgi:proline iminopeptidase
MQNHIPRAIVLAALSAMTLAAQTREGFIDVPGGPVWYGVIEKTKSGIPLIAVHGGPGGTSCSFSLLEPLASQRAVYFYDQLGGGRSGRPSDTKLWNVDRFVEELHRVRLRLGLKRVHLMGHSWGGALVAAYALSKGTKGIESLILASPLLSTPDWIRDADQLRLQLPRETQETLRRHEQAGTTNSAEYAAAMREFNQRFVSIVRKADPVPACRGSVSNQIIYQQMWGPSEFHETGSLKTFDVTPRLSELKVPVLLVVGEFDEARPETAARYQKAIPGAQLTVIPQSAHALLRDNPQATIQTLRDFITRVEQSRR